MKKFRVFFDMNGDLIIEADSWRDARQKVYSMSKENLIPHLNGDVNIEFDHIEEVLEEANSKNDDKAIDITIKVKKAAPNSGFKENLIKEVLPSLYLVFDDTINNENNNRSSLTLTRYIQNQKFNILHHTLTNKYPDINLIIISRQGYEALDKRIRKRNQVIFLNDFDEEKKQESQQRNIIVKIDKSKGPYEIEFIGAEGPTKRLQDISFNWQSEVIAELEVFKTKIWSALLHSNKQLQGHLFEIGFLILKNEIKLIYDEFFTYIEIEKIKIISKKNEQRDETKIAIKQIINRLNGIANITEHVDQEREILILRDELDLQLNKSFDRRYLEGEDNSV